MTVDQHESGGKRVSWVELYFDLVFVFAVSQVAHEMVAEPRWGGVLFALGPFVALWWTWIGFVVLYNRRGDDRRTAHRLTILAGTLPCVVAATQAHHVFTGHATGFALALAGTRLVLAAAYVFAASGRPQGFDLRTVGGYGFSALIFVLSSAVHGTWTYVLWTYAVLQEAAVLLLRERRTQARQWRRDRRERARSRHDEAGPPRRPSRVTAWLAQFSPPSDQAHALDAAHLAERFGLFMIILLGEIVISVGNAALERPHQDLAYWLGMGGALVLAGALWWIYFCSAADINERLLGASRGNPTLAHTLYASGHLLPAFSLLVVAAGVTLSLHEDPPAAASWLVTGGFAAYLAGTRVLSSVRRRWWAGPMRVLVLATTVCLALLDRVLVAPAVVATAACWAVGVAVVVTVSGRDALRLAGEDPIAFLRGS